MQPIGSGPRILAVGAGDDGAGGGEEPGHAPVAQGAAA
jgi:hypothetical protein